MRILGIGGLAGARAFKRLNWPNLDDREYSVAPGLDAAAALVINGELVASANEESFSRSVHTAEFPAKAIKFCLSAKNLVPEEIDALVHCFNYSDYEELYLVGKRSSELYRTVLSKEALLREVRRHLPTFPGERVQQISNHLAHAAGAYLTSGWDDCLVVVIDGLGDGQSATGYRASERGLVEIKEIAAYDSIAVLYSLISVHLGFNWQGDEWCLMDLASQGDASRFRPFFEQAAQLRTGGNIMIWPLRLNRRSGEKENYPATRRCLFDYLGPKRLPNGEILQRHKDVAAGLQECVNRVLLHLCKNLADATGQRRIALSGQVPSNCAANDLLLRSEIFEEVYIPTPAGDDGAAIGAALYVAWQEAQTTKSQIRISHVEAGYSITELRAAYDQFAGQIQAKPFLNAEEKCRQIAALIAGHNIVARDEGGLVVASAGSENRSILADPSDPEMAEKLGFLLNEETGRRPVAALVTVEQADRWFDLPHGIKLYERVLTASVKAPFPKQLAAVTLQDGTARIQAIDRRDRPELHGILAEIGKLTGCEVVLTTSFNVAGQPIVNSPQETLETFLQTEIEYLVLGNCLVVKKGINGRDWLRTSSNGTSLFTSELRQ
jgi:carbamoyltransferase